MNRLYRSRTNVVIAGVCGGLGDYLGIDPVLVRIFFVLFTLAGGIGPLVYFLLWLIVPREDTVIAAGSANEWESRASHMRDEIIDLTRRPNPDAAKWVGAGLVILGSFWFLQALHLPWLRWFNSEALWPLLLIVAGGVFLWRALRGGKA
jgi:phage shock protein C